MVPYFQSSDVTIFQADSRDAWQYLPEHSADAIVTSPPYFGLRDYGVDGQVGLEDNPQEYVDDLADLLTGYGSRVLKPGGSLWLNLGDTYNGSKKGSTNGTGGTLNEPTSAGENRTSWQFKKREDRTWPNKSLLMIPERVALALIERGWILRNRVVWAKPNGMPSSVRDRLATKHEALFHLVRQPRYYYNLDAIRDPNRLDRPQDEWSAQDWQAWRNLQSGSIRTQDSHRAAMGGERSRKGNRANPSQDGPGDSTFAYNPAGKNPGDVWTIPTQPYPDAHFAVFPPELVRRPILATVPEQVCRACGTGRQREMRWDPFALDMDRPQARRAIELAKRHKLSREHLEAARSVGMNGIGKLAVATGKKHLSEGSQLAVEAYEALGSYLGEFSRAKFVESGRSDCGCDAGWTSGTVLDPFFGSGTTAVMARKLGRKAVGVELNPDYCRLAADRFRQDVLTFDEEVPA